MQTSSFLPVVIESTDKGERSWDIYSRLLKDRTIFVNTQIDSQSASSVIAQLLFLESESSTTPITMFVMSPGGSVDAGLALVNTISYISAPVHTIGMGMIASMGSFIAMSGTKGYRFLLPDTKTLVHQPSGGVGGGNGGSQATDIARYAEEIIKTKTMLTQRYVDNSGYKDYEFWDKLLDRDTILNAETAVEYGLADKIIKSKSEVV
jgi:ATP-dependent Clp protease protease subunit